MNDAPFEGRPLPVDLDAALGGDPATRAWLVRAAVARADVAQALRASAQRLLLSPSADDRGAALLVLRALVARPQVSAACAAFSAAPERFVGIADPCVAGRTLAQSCLAFVAEAAPRTHEDARALLRAAMGVPELRLDAWRALAADDGEGPLPFLGELLTEHPALAGSVATQYALVHTPLCERAAEAVAGLPLATRRAFADRLQKHLLRIHSVRRWVACRRLLLGR